MSERPSKDEWGLQLAQVVATRGTCARRKVGCVLLDTRGHILSTGYNGPASGAPHCSPIPDLFVLEEFRCLGMTFSSGQGLDKCQAIHAEQNALMQCPKVWDIDTCYVTTSPCLHCAKMLLNTSCQRIVFREAYTDAEQVRHRWLSSRKGRTWIQLAPTEEDDFRRGQVEV